MADEKRNKFKGLYVEVKKDGVPDINVDNALKKIKRMIKDDNLMLRLQQKSHYIKPSEIKRDKKSRALARERHITRVNNN